MSTQEKLFLNLMSGNKDKQIRFRELQRILDLLVFQCRIKGDHFIYYRNDVDEIINIQPDGDKAKPYQVKQVRNLILKYKLEV